MTGFLLDTNVVSELRKADRADVHLRHWFQQHVDAEFWLSALVIGELHRGVELVARRDRTSARRLRAWLDSVVADYEDRILPVTVTITRRWAQISVPDPLPIIDGLLAATAIEQDLTLVTRHVADVERTGVRTANPFDPR